MRLPRPTLLPGAALALVLLALSQPGAAQDAVLVPPAEAVAGRSQASWSEVWWQWAWSFPLDDSPLADDTGSRCAARQSGEVFFLAGTFGTRRAVRTCVVPRDRHLFFPLINFVAPPRPDGAGNCLQAMRAAAELTERPAGLVLAVDGVRFSGLEAHRQATIGCFDLGARLTPPTRMWPSAGNGFYVMLRPLPPGRHTVEFGGALPEMLQAVTYTLIVE